MSSRTGASYARAFGVRLSGLLLVGWMLNGNLSLANEVDEVGPAQAWENQCNAALGYMGCANMMHPRGHQGPAVGYDPCYLAQNAMRPCAKEQPQPPKSAGIDPKIVGTWEFPLEGGRWVLEILRNGSYRFHSEAGDGVPAHAGTFAASNGHWLLKAANGYTDGGTYVVQPGDTWIATGQLGTAAWRHPSMTAASGKR